MNPLALLRAMRESTTLAAAPVPVSPDRPTRTPREHLFGLAGDEGLVGRYGSELAGDLLLAMQRWEWAARRRHPRTVELARAYFETWRHVEAARAEGGGSKGLVEPYQKPREAPRIEATASRLPPSDEPLPWPAELEGLTRWLLTLEPAVLPPEPWSLRPGVTVYGNTRFLAALQQNIRHGPSGPRARTGALQADIRDLAKLLQRQENHSDG